MSTQAPQNFAARPAAHQDPRIWQSWLDRNAEMFASVRAGARIGVVRRRELGLGRGEMIVWERDARCMRAGMEPFTGFGECDVEVLLALDDAAQASLLRDGAEVARRLVHERRLQVFVPCAPADISRAGLDEFIDTLALAVPQH